MEQRQAMLWQIVNDEQRVPYLQRHRHKQSSRKRDSDQRRGRERYADIVLSRDEAALIAPCALAQRTIRVWWPDGAVTHPGCRVCAPKKILLFLDAELLPRDLAIVRNSKRTEPRRKTVLQPQPR